MRRKPGPDRKSLIEGKIMINVSKKISENDEMFADNEHHYFSVGENALREVLAFLGDFKPSKILDLPCGHGRVARYLVAQFPESELDVADLNEDGAHFCVSEFGATMLKSQPEFATLNFDKKYDLIWVGSLVTHLDAEAASHFLQFVSRHLTQEGRAIVTTHGALVAGRLLHRGESVYGIDADKEHGICMRYFETGYGYHGYPHSDEYGISICSEAWMHKASHAAGLKVTGFKNHAWDNHQDMYCLMLK